jgi:hypothetical protein
MRRRPCGAVRLFAPSRRLATTARRQHGNSPRRNHQCIGTGAFNHHDPSPGRATSYRSERTRNEYQTSATSGVTSRPQCERGATATQRPGGRAAGQRRQAIVAAGRDSRDCRRRAAGCDGSPPSPSGGSQQFRRGVPRVRGVARLDWGAHRAVRRTQRSAGFGPTRSSGPTTAPNGWCER